MFVECNLENGKKCLVDFNCVQTVVELNDKHCKIIFDDPVVVAHPFKDIQRTIRLQQSHIDPKHLKVYDTP